MIGRNAGSDEQALAAGGASGSSTEPSGHAKAGSARHPSPADLGVLLRNALSLSGTSVLNLPLGFAFWWVAAHHYPAEAVGLASAAVSAMLLLANLSALGFGTLLIAELARGHRNRAGLVLTSLLVVGGAGFVLGWGFAVVAPQVSSHLAPLNAHAWSAAFFAVGVSLATVALVLDQALIGIMRGGLQFWRNLALAAGKLVLLVALALISTRRVWEEIYASWALGTVASFGIVAAVLIGIGVRPVSWRPDWRAVTALRRAAGWHHALNLSLAAPQFMLPIIATAVLSPRLGAYFYVAWIGGTIPSIAPGALATVLFAVGAAEPRLLARRVRQTLTYSYTALATLGTPLFLLAPLVLQFFGSDYRIEATTAMRVIIVAGIPLVLRAHFVAVSRSSGRLAQAVAFLAVTAVLEVAAAVEGARVDGITGLAVGWAIVLFLEAAILLRPLATMRRWVQPA